MSPDQEHRIRLTTPGVTARLRGDSGRDVPVGTPPEEEALRITAFHRASAPFTLVVWWTSWLLEPGDRAASARNAAVRRAGGGSRPGDRARAVDRAHHGGSCAGI